MRCIANQDEFSGVRHPFFKGIYLEQRPVMDCLLLLYNFHQPKTPVISDDVQFLGDSVPIILWIPIMKVRQHFLCQFFL
jgi:hypothetical protein